MNINITKIETFLDKMDQNLQGLVPNLQDKAIDNLENLETMLSDTEIYEVPVRECIQYFDKLSQQNQLDNSGDIETKTRDLKQRFETIKDDLSVMIKHTKMLNNVKLQISQSCGNIQKRLFDIERDISSCNPTAPCCSDLQNIGSQFRKQLEVLKQLDFESKDLHDLDSGWFLHIFEQLKESQRIFGDLSLQYGNIIRSSPLTGDASLTQSTRIPLQTQYEDFSSKDDKIVMERKVNSLIKEFLLHANATDGFLNWVKEILNSDITDIKSVNLDKMVDGKQIMNTFSELVQSCRQNIDLINGLDDEIIQLINTYKLLHFDGYHTQIAKELDNRWRVACRLAEERDKGISNKYGVKRTSTPLVSTHSSRISHRGSRCTHTAVMNSLKGSFDNESNRLSSRKGSRETCSSRHASQKGSMDYSTSSLNARKWSSESHVLSRNSRQSGRLSSFGDLYENRLTSLEDWIRVSIILIKKRRERTTATNEPNLNLKHIKFQLDELNYFLKDFLRWIATYYEQVGTRDKSNPIAVRLTESWKIIEMQTELWMNDLQQIILGSDQMKSEIKNISNQLLAMQRECSNERYLSNSFIDRFDQMKNNQNYWISQLSLITRRATHHLTLDERLSDAIDLLVEELTNLDNAVHKITLAIVEADSKQKADSKTKCLLLDHSVNDADTKTPRLNVNMNIDSSLMIPSIHSFEQPIDHNDLHVSNLKFRLYNDLPEIDNANRHANIHQTMSVENPKLTVSGDSSNWYHYFVRCFMISMLINCCIIFILSVIFMLQPDCENSWECSLSLSSFALKKHWSKSAAI